MKKSVIVGIAILVLAIAGGIAYKLYIDGGSSKAIPGLSFASKIETSNKPLPISAQGFAGYKLETISLDGETIPLIKIPVVTWGGYAALIAANNGVKPNKDSLFYKNGKFVVEIFLENNPNMHIDGFAQGKYPIMWTTVDTLPLLVDALKSDRRVMPQVFGIFDWSFGGDGIIVRNSIKIPKDLKGKKIVTAGNTPSHFFLLWLLSQSGISPSEVSISYVADAVSAKDAFIQDGSLDACVTWSPFLYEITDPASSSHVENTRLLITSKDANQLIADCYVTRADFAKEHADMIKAFSSSMMEGADLFEKNKEKVYKEMATLFDLKDGAHEAALMLGDVHIANFPENKMFFDIDNPISAYKIFFLAQEYYKNLGSLGENANYDPDSVIRTAFFQDFEKEGKFASQANTVKNSFNQAQSAGAQDLENSRVVLQEDIQIYFEAQKIEFDINKDTPEMKSNRRELTKISEQMQVLGTTVLKLIGHLDTSKVEEYKAKGNKDFLEASSQARLISKKRAEFIKKILVEVYKCDESRIQTAGMGWEEPVDAEDQSKNRRVEIRFMSFE